MTNKTIFSKLHIRTVGVIVALAAIISIGTVAYASHSWGDYHWARTANPFTLKLGDNLTANWDAYLSTASTDWNTSTVLDTAVVPTKSNLNCRATNGRVEVCNKKYGNNGWLGIASIWISGKHITQGTVKLNDTYFSTTRYNTPTWKQFVTCQEIGHTFGLGHQDENFSNTNLNTCMDYANDPTSNQHPNTHDYYQLQMIYGHLDSTNSYSTSAIASAKGGVSETVQNGDFSNASEWGKAIKKDSRGKTSLYERDLGKGNKIFTFVTWAE